MIESQNGEVIDPESIIKSAILQELKENPYCPIAGLLQDILTMCQEGDKHVLDIALKIAKETLSPQKPNFLSTLKKSLINRLI